MKNRQDRAFTLGKFLLSKAMNNQIDSETLQEALAIAKLPDQQLSQSQIPLDQLLDGFYEGKLSAPEFVKAWKSVKQGGKLPGKPIRVKPIAQSKKTDKTRITPLVLRGFLGFAILVTIVVFIRDKNLNRLPNELVKPLEAISGGSKASYVREGLIAVQAYKTLVADYYFTMGKFPNNNAEANLPQPAIYSSRALSQVEVGQGGTIIITFNHLVGSGQTIILTPSEPGNTQIQWDCSKGTVPVGIRPSNC